MPKGKPPPTYPRPERRQQVAYEAARLMAQGAAADFHQAKRKAASRLGWHDEESLPTNAEVERQLRDYQRLFQGDVQPQALQVRREAAVAAMRFLARFQPRLVGPVLDGTADTNAAIDLQLFTDSADEVGFFLLDSRIPAEARSQRLRLDRERDGDFPAWQFAANGLSFRLVVLPTALLRQAPLGPVDGRPMQRASLAALLALLDADRAQP
jgi:hypothetical protein